MSKVFVYGSLRRGGALHGALWTSELLGAFRTKPEYSLYSLGAFPALVEGGETAVLGEVYEVSEETLRYLDRIEGHPELYVRTPISLEDGTEVEVYIFPHKPMLNELVESGDWIGFQQSLT